MKYCRLLSLGLLVFFAACVPVRKEIYLQGETDKNRVVEDQVISSYRSKGYQYQLRPDDVVSIKVSSATPNEFNFLNYESDRTLTGLSARDPLLTGFKIEEDGTITLPVLGSVEIAGLTLAEARGKIQNIIEDYLESPAVDVKLLSFQYTVLGEVKNEGLYTTYHTKHSILDAIGNAGGLTDYANGTRIKIVRANGNDLEVAYINVLKEDLLSSPYYYLKPNDVVSIPPLKAKNWRVNNVANVSLILSGITSVGIFLNWIVR